MNYEVKICYSQETGTGKVKKVRETLYVKDADVFASAECKAIQFGIDTGLEGFMSDYDVTAIKRSAIREECNEKHEGDTAYRVTLDSKFVTDSGKEKHMRYQVLLWSSSPVQGVEMPAQLRDYLAQIDPNGNEFTVVAIQQTNITESL